MKIQIKNIIEFNFAQDLTNWLLEHEPKSKLIVELTEAIKDYMDTLASEQDYEDEA